METANEAASQTRASKDRTVQEQQAAVQRSRSEASGLQRSLEEAQASLRDAQSSHRVGLAAANAGRKDLQVSQCLWHDHCLLPPVRDN